MTTIMCDEEPGTRLPPPPGFVQPSIRQQLAEGFGDEADFYLLDGEPCVVWGMMDYALNFATYPVREIHPFLPTLDGQEVTENKFRAKVQSIHQIE